PLPPYEVRNNGHADGDSRVEQVSMDVRFDDLPAVAQKIAETDEGRDPEERAAISVEREVVRLEFTNAGGISSEVPHAGNEKSDDAEHLEEKDREMSVVSDPGEDLLFHRQPGFPIRREDAEALGKTGKDLVSLCSRLCV